MNSWRWGPWVECACGPGLGICRGEPQQASRHPRLSALCCATCQAQHMIELGSCLALRAHHVRSCPRSASWSPVLLTPLSLALLQARRTTAQPDIPEGPGVGRHHVAQLVAQWAAAGWRLRGVCGLSCLGCSLGQGHTHRSRWVGRLLGADAVQVWCQGWGSCWLVPHRGGQASSLGRSLWQGDKHCSRWAHSVSQLRQAPRQSPLLRQLAQCVRVILLALPVLHVSLLRWPCCLFSGLTK